MNRLKELRIENNKTQKDLSRFLNITDVAYYYYESEKRDMSPEIILKLSNYFNVSTDYLLGKTDIKNAVVSISKIPILRHCKSWL